MGRIALDGMLEVTDADTALQWHLQSNHFPPLPPEILEPAKLAIQAALDEDWDAEIPLPAGVNWRDQTSAPTWACIEGWHLEGFLE